MTRSKRAALLAAGWLLVALVGCRDIDPTIGSPTRDGGADDGATDIAPPQPDADGLTRGASCDAGSECARGLTCLRLWDKPLLEGGPTCPALWRSDGSRIENRWFDDSRCFPFDAGESCPVGDRCGDGLTCVHPESADLPAAVCLPLGGAGDPCCIYHGDPWGYPFVVGTASTCGDGLMCDGAGGCVLSDE